VHEDVERVPRAAQGGEGRVDLASLATSIGSTSEAPNSFAIATTRSLSRSFW